nr:MAG TPA: TIP49 AAA-lid domain [Caudoviricetes sp.]
MIFVTLRYALQTSPVKNVNAERNGNYVSR